MDTLTLLLAQQPAQSMPPDPATATMDWIISRGLVGGALAAVFILGLVIKKMYADNQALHKKMAKFQEDLQAQRAADLKSQKDEVKALAQETTAKVEKLMEKQVALVERVVETQVETNAAIRSLREMMDGEAA